MGTTFSNLTNDESLTLEKVVEAMNKLREEEKKLEPRKKGIIERILNHFGYHKGDVAMFIVDKQQIKDLAWKSYISKTPSLK